MGLFSRNFDRPGPGVAPDAPRKKGFARLFELLSRDLGSFFWAGLLAFAGSLPFIGLMSVAILGKSLIYVLLAGVVGGLIAAPELTGLADTMLRSLRDEPGFWWVTYRRAWKRNLKASLLPGVVMGLVFAVQLFSVYNLQLFGDSLVTLVLLLLGVLLALGLNAYLWPQIALMDLSFPHLLRNCALLFLAYLPRTLGAIGVQVLLWGVLLLYFPYSAIFLPLVTFWLCALLTTFFAYVPLNKSFDIEAKINTIREQDFASKMNAEDAGVPAHAEKSASDKASTESANADKAQPAVPLDGAKATPAPHTDNHSSNG